MRIRNNDENNDWTFGRSELDYLRNSPQAVMFNIKTKLQEWRNDFFAGLNIGVDYKTWLSYRGGNKGLDDDIKRVILAIPEVLELSTFDSIFDHEASEYRADFSVKTIYGDETIEDSIEMRI